MVLAAGKLSLRIFRPQRYYPMASKAPSLEFPNGIEVSVSINQSCEG